MKLFAQITNPANPRVFDVVSLAAQAESLDEAQHLLNETLDLKHFSVYRSESHLAVHRLDWLTKLPTKHRIAMIADCPIT